MEGITSVEINPLTGSALIHFDEHKIKYEQVISFLEKGGYFVLSKAKTSDEVVEKAAEKVLEVAEKIQLKEGLEKLEVFSLSPGQ